MKYDCAITVDSALANCVGTRGENMGECINHSITRFLLVLSIAAFAVSVLNTHLVDGTPAPSILVDPQQSFADLGSSFDVRVNVSEAVDVAGYSINMKLNQTILVVTGWRSGGFLETSGVGTFGIIATNHSDAGWVSLGSVLAGPGSASGSGTLVILSFKVIGNGNCTLHIYNTQLTDHNNELIDHTEADGSFTVMIPEFPSFIILPLFTITTLLAVVAYKKRLKNSANTNVAQGK